MRWALLVGVLLAFLLPLPSEFPEDTSHLTDEQWAEKVCADHLGWQAIDDPGFATPIVVTCNDGYVQGR